jgi:hypothetical protein
MSKFLTYLIAAMFAVVSVNAMAMKHGGGTKGEMKKEEKMEKKAEKKGKAKAMKKGEEKKK